MEIGSKKQCIAYGEALFEYINEVLGIFPFDIQRLNMLSNILRNKWFIGGFGLLIVFSVLCYLWYQHDVASFQQQLSSISDIVLQRDTSKKTQNNVHTDGQLIESRKSEKNRAKSVRDTSVPTDQTTRQTDTFEKNTNLSLAADSQTSPFGFGPYPEVPADFPYQERLWNNDTPEQELLVRVRIELWKQGTETTGAGFDTNSGLIYPTIPGVLYVRWQNTEDDDPEYAGRRYASLIMGDPDTSDKWGSSYLVDSMFEPIHGMSDIEALGIRVYEYPDGGLDPYKFLDLPR